LEATVMLKLPAYKVRYDDGADVLYVSAPDVVAVRGVEDPQGIVWRYGGDGRLVGATVIGMTERWSVKRSELASALARIDGFQNAASHVENAFSRAAV
jgi:Protein of unknown function (DUF2283)